MAKTSIKTTDFDQVIHLKFCRKGKNWNVLGLFGTEWTPLMPESSLFTVALGRADAFIHSQAYPRKSKIIVS